MKILALFSSVLTAIGIFGFEKINIGISVFIVGFMFGLILKVLVDNDQHLSLIFDAPWKILVWGFGIIAIVSPIGSRMNFPYLWVGGTSFMAILAILEIAKHKWPMKYLYK